MNSETTTSGQLHLSQRTVRTPRLTTNIWVAGPEDGTPLLLVHGNMSTGGFWEYVAKELPDSVRVIAPDLRGFGATDPLPVDATRGLGDMVDDVRSLLEQRGLTGQQRVHTVGWSLGAGVLQQYALAYPDDLATMTWVAPVSPYGYGGTKDTAGTWCHDDAAGSGAGIANPAVVQRLADKDASADGTQTSPRHVMVSLYGPGQNAANVDEEFLVQQLLTTVTGVDNYPGDALESPNWPMAAPGTKGVLNTISPKYFNTSALVGLGRKPPITWVHGGCDQVIGDQALLDLATLGMLEVIPGWPGEQVMPPQPMESQTRAVLEAYADGGGAVLEVAMPDAAHGIPLSHPGQLAQHILVTVHQAGQA
ncbi:MAG: alpha/beta hydrolase [Micrococcales bacterium]|nr:MAG: alpha/beta hydrolase [Micrococcales bacterium]